MTRLQNQPLLSRKHPLGQPFSILSLLIAQASYLPHLLSSSFMTLRFPPSVRAQVMNLLQMTVLAGSPGGFLPNTYPGVLAATLARVIRTSAGGSWAGVEAGGNSSSTGASGGEANDRLASQMVFSLRSVMGWPAKSTAVRLLEGKADPSNPPSKFLMALCKQSHTGSVEVMFSPVIDSGVCGVCTACAVCAVCAMRVVRFVNVLRAVRMLCFQRLQFVRCEVLTGDESGNLRFAVPKDHPSHINDFNL